MNVMNFWTSKFGVQINREMENWREMENQKCKPKELLKKTKSKSKSKEQLVRLLGLAPIRAHLRPHPNATPTPPHVNAPGPRICTCHVTLHQCHVTLHKFHVIHNQCHVIQHMCPFFSIQHPYHTMRAPNCAEEWRHRGASMTSPFLGTVTLPYRRVQNRSLGKRVVQCPKGILLRTDFIWPKLELVGRVKFSTRLLGLLLCISSS